MFFSGQPVVGRVWGAGKKPGPYPIQSHRGDLSTVVSTTARLLRQTVKIRSPYVALS